MSRTKITSKIEEIYTRHQQALDQLTYVYIDWKDGVKEDVDLIVAYNYYRHQIADKEE